ncbi:hypothetical protein [Turicibacter sp. TJ11]|uniref:hypothetical protein n=1 Tax=Turicibacter sp. TJ11 TaxID=2806443 RepID=UPI001F1F6CF4|nr:hypothetical protein [Turicibacter sp. TJ11]
MLEPTPLFKPYQFVQQLEFKNKDIHRSDLGIDYFGFIQTSRVIERTTIEYDVVFTQSPEQPILEYSLRALQEDEIRDYLAQIAKSPDKYSQFIQLLNSEPTLEKYHLH